MAQVSALGPVRIVELSERVAGEYCGKLLADFGAELIKVERPGGSPTRAYGPFATGKDGARHGAVFAYLNTSKKSVVLDLAGEADHALLRKLLHRADVLIDDHDEQWAARHRLGPEDVAPDYPGLIHCAITPFGQGAPADWQRARPINVINMGGWGYHTPSEVDPAKPPLKGAGRFMSDYEAGLEAALCIAAALHRKHRTGRGQFIDVSEVETQVSRADFMIGRMITGEAEPNTSRRNFDMPGPGASFACKDGFVFLIMTTGGHWRGLCTLMGEPDWAKAFPANWLEFGCTPERVVAFRQHFAEWIAQQEKDSITESAQKLGVAMVPVSTAADLPGNPQFAHRGYFQSLIHPAFGELRVPTVPYRMSATPVRLSTPAPALGEHDVELAALAQGTD